MTSEQFWFESKQNVEEKETKTMKCGENLKVRPHYYNKRDLSII